MSTKRFRVRYAIVDVVLYDGSEASIRRIMKMLGPAAQVMGPATIGDTLFIDGIEAKPSDVIVREKNGRYWVFEAHVFEAIYERDSADVGRGSLPGVVVPV
jgi:hypothetical protein